MPDPPSETAPRRARPQPTRYLVGDRDQPPAPVAPLARETAITGGLMAAAALGTLAVAAPRAESPAQAGALWLTALGLVGLASLARCIGVVRPSAPGLRPHTAVERGRDTLRRAAVIVVPPIALALVAVFLSAEFGALMAGVAGGVGLSELWLCWRAMRVRRRGGVEVLRELGTSPFAPPRRPVYTRPVSASTEVT